MGWLFENFQILLVIGLALAAWLKNRAEAKQEEEAERNAREEMLRQLQERENRPVHKTPPPVPNQWDTRPSSSPPPPPPSTQPNPPQLKDIFKEVIESVAPPIPASSQQEAPDRDAYDDEPAPWKSFQHVDATHTEIGDVDHDPLESPMLKRQREMQERLAEIKREAAQYKGKVAGARETQRRLARKHQPEGELVPLGNLRSALKDKRQVKRAVILREILGQPVGMRSTPDSPW